MMPAQGQYKSTPDTLASGDLGNLQLDSSGKLLTAAAGNAASGAADSGNPVKIGALVETAAPSASRANGNRADCTVDAYGALRVMPAEVLAGADGNGNSFLAGIRMSGNWGVLQTAGYVFNGTTWDRQRGDTNGTVVQPAPSSTFWQYAAAAGGIVSSTVDVALKAAGGAGVRNYISAMTINHDTLSAVTECVVKDGATVIWRGKLQTTATDVANGAGTIKFDPPLRGTANTALNFALLTSVTGGVFVNAQGYTGS